MAGKSKKKKGQSSAKTARGPRTQEDFELKPSKQHVKVSSKDDNDVKKKSSACKYEVSLNENEMEIVTFFIQTKCLVWKNMLLMQRKLSVFLFILATPIAVGCMLNIMVGIGNIVHNMG